MFLSFLVPVYNGEAYLRECLDALLDQDLTDYEILCVDDGSTDESPSILRQYAQAHPNIRVLRQESQGVCAARNAALSAAQGTYIWFVDCDDLIQRRCLSSLREIAEKSHCDRLIVGAYQFTDAMTEDEWARSRQNALPANSPWYDSVVWRCLLRRDFLEENRLTFQPPELTHGEDGLYMYQVVSAHPVDAETQQTLYFYREHSGSAETGLGVEALSRRLKSHARIAEILLDYYQNGRKDQPTADKLMSFLWLSLYETAKLPGPACSASLSNLKHAGLYPFRRLPECTIRRSYMTARTDFLGKAFDFLYLHLHTPLAFHTMHLIHRLAAFRQNHSRPM